MAKITQRDLDRLDKAVGRIIAAVAAAIRCAGRQGIVTMSLADRIEKAEAAYTDILNALRAKAED